MKILICR